MFEGVSDRRSQYNIAIQLNTLIAIETAIETAIGRGRSCGFVVQSMMGLFVQSVDVEKDVDSQLELILL